MTKKKDAVAVVAKEPEVPASGLGPGFDRLLKLGETLLMAQIAQLDAANPAAPRDIAPALSTSNNPGAVATVAAPAGVTLAPHMRSFTVQECAPCGFRGEVKAVVGSVLPCQAACGGAGIDRAKHPHGCPLAQIDTTK